jgi:hypothetical protein
VAWRKRATRQVGREKEKYEALVDSVSVEEGYSGSRLLVRNFKKLVVAHHKARCATTISF